MKTIEERAREYADAEYPKCGLYDSWADDGFDEGYNAAMNSKADRAFIAGAQSEHEELTRWNDPNIALPDEGTEVLVKYDDMRVFMACYENSQFGWNCYEPRSAQWYSLESGVIAGWRNIY